MPKLIPVLDKETIAHHVAQTAKQISADYEGSDLVVIGVLKGAFVFLADLVRQLTVKSVAIEFVRLSSYGNCTTTSAKMCLLTDMETSAEGKDLLIVEDILDTGHSLDFLYKHFKSKRPRTLKTCVLIDKHQRREIDLQPDYVCHTIDKGFLVGYGLDHAEAYRNLPGIFEVCQH